MWLRSRSFRHHVAAEHVEDHYGALSLSILAPTYLRMIKKITPIE